MLEGESTGSERRSNTVVGQIKVALIPEMPTERFHFPIQLFVVDFLGPRIGGASIRTGYV